MKKSMYLTGLVTVWLAGAAPATLINYSSGTLSTAIPDGNPVGVTFSDTVGNSAAIENVDVTLNISGGYNGDLYGYLVLNNGSGSYMSVLLNRVGTTSGNAAGYGDAGMNVTLSGLGGNDIHLYQNYTPTYVGGQLTGTYGADGRTADPATVTDASARTAGLDALNGQSAAGTWTLFLADLSGGGQSTLVSWGMEISVVPEPVTWALAGFAGILAGARLLSLRTARKSA